MKKTIHTGFTLDQDGTKTIYFVDNVDDLSCEIREYEKIECEDFSWMRLMGKIAEGEYFRYNKYIVSIGDMYYETVDEDA